MAKIYLLFLRMGCLGRGGGCLNRSCENTPCNNLSKHLASWTKEPTRSFWTTRRAAKIFATPFIFAAAFSRASDPGDFFTSPSKQNRFRMRWLVLSKCHRIPRWCWRAGTIIFYFAAWNCRNASLIPACLQIARTLWALWFSGVCVLCSASFPSSTAQCDAGSELKLRTRPFALGHNGGLLGR